MNIDMQMCKGRVVACVACSSMVLITNKGLLTLARVNAFPLTMNSTFRLTYCIVCRDECDARVEDNFYTTPGSVINASMVMDWQQYKIVSRAFGAQGFLLPHMHDEVDGCVIERRCDVEPAWGGKEMITTINIGSTITLSKYESGSFFGVEMNENNSYLYEDEEKERSVVVDVEEN